jgi:hypothetical protein
MPRYYFHLASRVPSEDENGIILPKIASARTEAVRFAIELARVSGATRAVTRGDIIVTDETGKTILTLSMSPRRQPICQWPSTVRGSARPRYPLRADR